jgi:hypothetical protein
MIIRALKGPDEYQATRAAGADESFDARWAAWQTKAAVQDGRWRSNAIVATILLGCSLAVALAGVIYVG